MKTIISLVLLSFLVLSTPASAFSWGNAYENAYNASARYNGGTTGNGYSGTINYNGKDMPKATFQRAEMQRISLNGKVIGTRNMATGQTTYK